MILVSALGGVGASSAVAAISCGGCIGRSGRIGIRLTICHSTAYEGSVLNETSISLLERMRLADHPDDWSRLHDLYAPWLQNWMRRYDVDMSDADDLLQEVLMAVAKDIASFEHNGRPGAFRAWLKRILINRLRDFWKSRGRLAAGGSDVMDQLQKLEDPQSDLSQLWDREHDRHVLAQLLKAAQPHFAPGTWQAFRSVVIERVPAREVAEELGMTVNAVFIAKSRVVSRLRREADGLVEASSDFF